MSPREIAAKAWHGLEIASTVATIGIAVLLSVGWRITKPSERFAAVESEVAREGVVITAMQQEHLAYAVIFARLERLQCLATTRHDANLAGACVNLPTKDTR